MADRSAKKSPAIPDGFWHTRVDRKVIVDTDISSREFRIYAVLCMLAGSGRSVAVAVKRLGDLTRCKERTAQNALNALEKRGLIRREKHFKNGLQLANTYHLIGCEAECYAEDSAGTGVQISADDGAQISAPPAESCTGDCQNSAPRVLEIGSLEKPERPSPPTPHEESEENGEEGGASKPEKPEHDTAGEEQNPGPASGRDFCSAVLAKYHAILPELEPVRSVTAAHVREVEARIREDPVRRELGWWERYFRSIREHPWLMGENPKGWSASFDWLIAGRNMQKVAESVYSKRGSTKGGSESGWELQKRYTNEEGIVDARALLREQG